MSRDSFRLNTAAGWLTGLALLRDMFTSINNAHGGYERVLARRSKSFRQRDKTDFTGKRTQAAECVRRLRQLNKRGLVPVVYVGPNTRVKGHTAIARHFDGKRVSIYEAHDNAWYPSNAAYWAVR
jgi:hypothetical protein